MTIDHDKPVPRYQAGDWLFRLLVPAYIAFGAVMKLTTGRPIELPIIRLQANPGAQIERLAETIFPIVCALELVLAAFIVLGPRWSRWVALCVMIVFAGVLYPHLAANAASCGCFGVVQTSPKLLFITACSLAALILLLPATGEPLVRHHWKWTLVAALAASVVVSVVHVGRVPERLGWRAPVSRLVPANWVGMRVSDLPFFSSLEPQPGESRTWPFPEQEQTWVLWQRTCPHCHAYFAENWSEQTQARVVAVERPLSSRGFPADPAVLECPSCVRLRLKPGTFYWLDSTPIVITVRAGVVESVIVNPSPQRYAAPESP